MIAKEVPGLRLGMIKPTLLSKNASKMDFRNQIKPESRLHRETFEP
jgi:hypothetical protein